MEVLKSLQRVNLKDLSIAELLAKLDTMVSRRNAWIQQGDSAKANRAYKGAQDIWQEIGSRAPEGIDQLRKGLEDLSPDGRVEVCGLLLWLSEVDKPLALSHLETISQSSGVVAAQASLYFHKYKTSG